MERQKKAFADRMQLYLGFKGGYEYGYFDGRVVLFRATEQNNLRRALNPALGWVDRVLGTLEIHSVKGNHDSFEKSQIAGAVAESINTVSLDV